VIAAIIAADFRIRFRRLSTLVIFLLLSAVAYAWVPAPSTGRTLLQINGQRALYNSAAVGMARSQVAPWSRLTATPVARVLSASMAG